MYHVDEIQADGDELDKIKKLGFLPQRKTGRVCHYYGSLAQAIHTALKGKK
jgi:hypothetical protein